MSRSFQPLRGLGEEAATHEESSNRWEIKTTKIGLQNSNIDAKKNMISFTTSNKIEGSISHMVWPAPR